jgi:exopolyphosphatase/guanosine-5'-triphosphate,3'-diphosphate pyrophosphatase
MRIAAIDVGSNSIHMVVAQIESDGRFHVLDRAKERVRLGHRTLTSGKLSAEAIEAGMRTLATFKMLADRHGAERIKAVATSAVREAANGGEFIRRVRDEIGLRVRVIPGREEARLIFLGVAHAIDLAPEPTVIVDAGGGSVELILAVEGRPVQLHSTKLGVTRLSEKFLGSDPPSNKELNALQEHVVSILEPALKGMQRYRIRRVVGTSGTMLDLVTIAGHRRGVPPEAHLNNYVVSADEIARVRRQLQKASYDERLRIKGLDSKRADVIVAGACIADEILGYLEAEEMVACTWALREGVLLDFIARNPRKIAEVEQFEDPRRRSVARLLRHLGEENTHGQHVAQLAVELHDQLADRLGLPSESREWLEFASLLHDVGHHIGHRDHHRHSQYLIANGELLGFRKEEVEIIGLVARYHQKAVPKDDDEEFGDLSKADRQIVRGLSALLRVADGLDRSHYSVVKHVVVQSRGQKTILQLQTEGDDAELEEGEGVRRVPLLAELLGVDVEFEVQEDAYAGQRATSAAG